MAATGVRRGSGSGTVSTGISRAGKIPQIKPQYGLKMRLNPTFKFVTCQCHDVSHSATLPNYDVTTIYRASHSGFAILPPGILMV